MAWATGSVIREYAIVAVIFLVVALAATWPLASSPATHSVSDRANNDVFLNQYLIFWGAHAAVNEPSRLYDTNMFHPERYGFAYADMLLTDSLLLAPVILAFYDPTLTYNALLWLAIVIGGTGMYFLARLLTGSRFAALAAGLVFVANPTHFVRYRQPQFFNDGILLWFLGVLLLWLGSCGLWQRGRGPESVSERRSLGLAGLAALLFCLHAQTGSHNAVFGLLLGGGLYAYHVIPAAYRLVAGSGPGQADLRRLAAGTALMAAIGILVLAPLFYPYLEVGEHLRGDRVGTDHETTEVLAAGSAGALEMLTASSHFYRWLDASTGWPSRYFGKPDGANADLFPGFVLPLLLFAALLPRTRLSVGAVARRAGPWALDLLVLAGAVVPCLTWATGWRRLGTGFPPVPTIWIWPLLAVAALSARALLCPRPPHVLSVAPRILPRQPDKRFWAVAVFLCFWASLGPAFGLYQVVHAIPGANLIRVPSRFVLPMVMSASVLAAWGVVRIRKSAGRRGLGLLAALGAFFALEASFAPLPVVPAPYPPDPAAVWLGEQAGDFAVLEIPVDTNPTPATRQMLQSIYHWKRLLIGYSGSAPPGYEERMARYATSFAEPAVLDELAELDVRYLLVLQDRANENTQRALEASPRLQQVQRFGNTVIWELLPDGTLPD